MIYTPILGALALASMTVLNRFILRKRKVEIKTFITASFLSTIIVMLPLIFFFWKLDQQAFALKNIFIFFLIICASIIANLLLFYGIKGEKISNIEPAIIFGPLFTILLALVFSFIFGTTLFQRNFNVIIPAIIASLALIFSHIKKDKIVFNKYFLSAITGSFFFALELVLSRLILDYYSPILFYFFRCFAIFIFALVFFKPQFSTLNTRIKWEIFLIGALWVIYRGVIYYGYLQLGVIFTTLIIMLAPIFVYFFAWKFLHEKIDKRNIFAAIVIVACILYVILV